MKKNECVICSENLCCINGVDRLNYQECSLILQLSFRQVSENYLHDFKEAIAVGITVAAHNHHIVSG